MNTTGILQWAGNFVVSLIPNHLVITASTMITLNLFSWENYIDKVFDKWNIVGTVARSTAMVWVNDKTNYALNSLIKSIQKIFSDFKL